LNDVLIIQKIGKRKTTSANAAKQNVGAPLTKVLTILAEFRGIPQVPFILKLFSICLISGVAITLIAYSIMSAIAVAYPT